MSQKPRVLFVITAYNGRSFVPRCLRSAMHLDRDVADIDVLLLDDASPEPGFSEFIEAECKALGVAYYRSPRNLGIVRNVNLGLVTASENDYDYVVISNSDVVYARSAVSHLIAAARTDPRIGSVTAWSNNVSIYSIPNEDPDAYLASQDVVDWVGASLAGNFHGTAIDIPAGISFSILIPIDVLRHVGLTDPVFGRGYCEETDWSLRSLAMGYRLALAPAAFVYHQGRGSTLGAGMVSGGHTTVPHNEAIIDFRYPLFRSQVDAFIHGGILEKLWGDSQRLCIRDGARQFGYRVVPARPGRDEKPHDAVFVYDPQARKPTARGFFLGFSADVPVDPSQPERSIADFVEGKAPGSSTGAETRPAAHPERVTTRQAMYPRHV